MMLFAHVFVKGASAKNRNVDSDGLFLPLPMFHDDQQTMYRVLADRKGNAAPQNRKPAS